MAATYRDSISAETSGATIAVNPATLTYQAGDVLALFVWGINVLGNPNSSDVTWTQRVQSNRADGFGNQYYGRIYTTTAISTVASFALSHGANDEYGYSLISVQGADTASPMDGTATGNNALNGAPTAPSITDVAGSDSLMLVGAIVMPTGGAPTPAFTPPAGMTEREDITSFYAHSVASLGLSGSGATGTKAFTAAGGTGAPWIALSIAIKSAAGGGGRVTKNTRAYPLGVKLGMGFRMPA